MLAFTHALQLLTAPLSTKDVHYLIHWKKESGIILLLQNSSLQLSLSSSQLWVPPKPQGGPWPRAASPGLCSAGFRALAQVGLNALSQGTRTVLSSFPLDTEMLYFVTVLESIASPSKQLFQTGHSLPQLRACRWDLLCCRERPGASWDSSRSLLSPECFCQDDKVSAQVPTAEGWQRVVCGHQNPTDSCPPPCCLMHSFLLLPPTCMAAICAQYPQHKVLPLTEALQTFS